MKTTVLFRMIVLVAMVFAGIANTTVKAQGNNFITNEEKVDDLVVSKVIYRLDGCNILKFFSFFFVVRLRL